MVFKGNFCTILHPNESIIAKVTHSDGLYCMSANIAETINNNQFTLYTNMAWRPLSLYELHCRLGHIHYGAIKDAIRNGLVKGLELTLIMVMSNFAKLAQLENQQPNCFQRNHSPVQPILERVSTGTYGDLRV